MTIKKVLLINPPGVVHLFPDGRPAHRKHCVPPLGLAYLAAAVRENGYEVEILDILAEGYGHEELRGDRGLVYGLPIEEVLERVRQVQPDLMGISMLFSSSASEAHDICRALKLEFPEITIVAGGQHPTGAPRPVMVDPSIDYVLLGEADASFVSLLNTLNSGSDLGRVQGLFYRDGDTVRSTMEGVKPAIAGKDFNYYLVKDTALPTDLDHLPYPAWDLFPMDAYWDVDVRISGGDAATSRYGVMVSTRGCPHACDYCTSPLQSGFRGYRKRSNESTIKEIRWLVDDLGVKEVMFFDDNFFVSVPRAKELIKMIGDEFPETLFSVPGGTEVNALDDELIDLMAASNFYKLTLNIESGNQELQDARIDKKVKLGRVPQIVDRLREKGIETKAMLMIGFPGETRESIDRTVELAKSLDVDDFFLSIVSPLPGTPLWDECIEKGLLIDGASLDNVRYSLSTIKLPDTTPEELENIRYTVWKEHFELRRKKLNSQPHKKFEDREEYETVGYKFQENSDQRARQPHL